MSALTCAPAAPVLAARETPLDLTGTWQLRRLRGQEPSPAEVVQLLSGEAGIHPRAYPGAHLLMHSRFHGARHVSDTVNWDEARTWAMARSLDTLAPPCWPALAAERAARTAYTRQDPLDGARLTAQLHASDHVRDLMLAVCQALRGHGLTTALSPLLLRPAQDTETGAAGCSEEDRARRRHVLWLAGEVNLTQLCAPQDTARWAGEARKAGLSPEQLLDDQRPHVTPESAEAARLLLSLQAAQANVPHPAAQTLVRVRLVPTSHVDELLSTGIFSGGSLTLRTASWVLAALRHPAWASTGLTLSPPSTTLTSAAHALCTSLMDADLPAGWHAPLCALKAALHAELHGTECEIRAGRRALQRVRSLPHHQETP